MKLDPMDTPWLIERASGPLTTGVYDTSFIQLYNEDYYPDEHIKLAPFESSGGGGFLRGVMERRCLFRRPVQESAP